VTTRQNDGLDIDRLADAMVDAFRATAKDHWPFLTGDGCGKPESDPIHPGSDERMGGGRHVYRYEPRVVRS
jgi:hypothetical protein